MELPDDVGADLAGGGQDPKEIPTRRWSVRVSEASRILPKHRGASVSAAWPPGELPDQPSTASRSSRWSGRESAAVVRLDGDEMAADADDGNAGHATGTYIAPFLASGWG